MLVSIDTYNNDNSLGAPNDVGILRHSSSHSPRNYMAVSMDAVSGIEF